MALDLEKIQKEIDAILYDPEAYEKFWAWVAEKYPNQIKTSEPSPALEDGEIQKAAEGIYTKYDNLFMASREAFKKGAKWASEKYQPKG